jgi:hypothetical protein
LLAPFFESLPLQTNKQQEEFSLQKRPVLFVALFLFEKVESTKIEVALSERSTGSDAEHGLFAMKLIELRAVAPADDDRLNPHPPQWCSFSLCLL